MKDTKKWVTAALMAALTTLATWIIQIPIPAGGYIHMGDGMVLLCGIILGPVTGGLAAGIGSMFADLIGGYGIYIVPTFIIKGLAAFAGGIIYHKLRSSSNFSKHIQTFFRMLFPSIALCIIVTGGYFLFESFLYGTVISASKILFTFTQNLVGIATSFILLPYLSKIPDVKTWMEKQL